MESVSRPETVDDIGIELVRDWVPADEPRATVVLIHGIAEHCGRYERTGGILSDSGFFVRSFDLVGAGGSGGNRWGIDDWDVYHDQIDRHMSWAAEQGRPVVLMGHSMGGNLALGYVLEDRREPDLLVLTAPAMDGGAGWQKALAPIVAKVAPNLAIPNNVRGEHLSRDPAVGEAYFSDPLVQTKSTAGFGAALFDSMAELQANYERLGIPTLVLQGGSDSIVPPQSTAPLGELPNVDRRLYPGLQHEILNEPEGPEIVQDIIDWLDQHL